jgi:hypothetical protein
LVEDLSVIWNGGEDFPVELTRRIEDGVVVVELEEDDDGDECRRLFVGLSRCESARRIKKIVYRLYCLFQGHTKW